MQQGSGKGSVDSLDNLSIPQLLDHIIKLCSTMESAFSTDAAHARPEDFLKLLEQERNALRALERQMDAALAEGVAPVDLQERLEEVGRAHRRCQRVLEERVEVSRDVLQKLSALQSGHDSYRQQAP